MKERNVAPYWKLLPKGGFKVGGLNVCAAFSLYRNGSNCSLRVREFRWSLERLSYCKCKSKAVSFCHLARCTGTGPRLVEISAEGVCRILRSFGQSCRESWSYRERGEEKFLVRRRFDLVWRRRVFARLIAIARKWSGTDIVFGNANFAFGDVHYIIWDCLWAISVTIDTSGGR